MTTADLISIPFSWDDLCDIIHYAEWKVEEVDEAGCDLEHPNIREVLKRLKYIQSRMRYSPTEEAQRIIDQEMIDQEDDEDYNPEFDAASYT